MWCVGVWFFGRTRHGVKESEAGRRRARVSFLMPSQRGIIHHPPVMDEA